MRKPLALLLSIKLKVVLAMSALAAVFLVGWMSQYFFGSHAEESVLAAAIYGILPDWQHFWMGDTLSDDGIIDFKYVFNALIYAGLYSTSLLAAGVALFWESELK